ncbi:MAG: metallophosphoesterase family protein [Oscillospiraceae bacterium]
MGRPLPWLAGGIKGGRYGKILHTADFHLDSAFTALPEEKARLRRQEARQLTDRLVDYANDHGVELLLLAGDLFDSDQLYGQTAQELAQSLARFRGHAVIAPGNHDFYAASSPYARLLWPENVHIFREERLQRLPSPIRLRGIRSRLHLPRRSRRDPRLSCPGG